MRVTSRWAAICARRGGEEWVQMREEFEDGYRWGVGKKEEAKERSRKTVETGGTGGMV